MTDIKEITRRLESNEKVFEHLLKGIPEEEARWKPAPDKWSILEVTRHLLDEEQEDFRMRLDLTLHNPGEPWPGIDPEAAAVERKYNEGRLGETLESFLLEREKSVAWLKGLDAPNLNASYTHPILGEILAGELLVAWLGHDFLHLRQLAGLRWDYASVLGAPYSTRYAKP